MAQVAREAAARQLGLAQGSTLLEEAQRSRSLA